MDMYSEREKQSYCMEDYRSLLLRMSAIALLTFIVVSAVDIAIHPQCRSTGFWDRSACPDGLRCQVKSGLCPIE